MRLGTLQGEVVMIESNLMGNVSEVRSGARRLKLMLQVGAGIPSLLGLNIGYLSISELIGSLIVPYFLSELQNAVKMGGTAES